MATPDIAPLDRLLTAADAALRTVFAQPRAARPCPRGKMENAKQEEGQRRLSAAYMRVDHVGEVCAQALYMGQAAVTRDLGLRAHLLRAAKEETDHLAWTRQRLDELNDRPSLLNPLWFAGAFALGATAGLVSDRVSLGFVVETETQVSEHLQSHLEKLPPGDHDSRAIVAQMKTDEERHADQARDAGAVELPLPAKLLMRVAAKVMTTTAHRI